MPVSWFLKNWPNEFSFLYLKSKSVYPPFLFFPFFFWFFGSFFRLFLLFSSWPFNLIQILFNFESDFFLSNSSHLLIFELCTSPSDNLISLSYSMPVFMKHRCEFILTFCIRIWCMAFGIAYYNLLPKLDTVLYFWGEHT